MFVPNLLLTAIRICATTLSANLGRSIFGAVAALFIALAAPEALAQSAQADQTVSAPEVKLEEIVVTATRKDESIQDVPISITAYDQAAIEALGIHTIQDIVSLTPG